MHNRIVVTAFLSILATSTAMAALPAQKADQAPATIVLSDDGSTMATADYPTIKLKKTSRLPAAVPQPAKKAIVEGIKLQICQQRTVAQGLVGVHPC